MIRVDGDLEKLKWRVLTDEEFESSFTPITPQRIYKEWKETGDSDFAYSSDRRPLRVNLFRQEHGSAAVSASSRPVLTIEDLGLPSIVASIARVPRGLVLITGPTARESRRRSPR